MNTVSKRQYGMVAVLLAGAFLVVLSATLLSPTLPTIMTDFGVSATTVQWLTSGYTMVEAVVIPLSAYLLGRFSTRKLFFSSMALFTGFSLVAACAPSFEVLLVGRVAQALGGGILMPMTITLVMLVFPRERRGMAMGLVTLVIGFAPALGPTVGGLLVDTVGWRALFGIVAALSAVVVICGVGLVTNEGGFERSSLDVASVVLMVAGMLCLLYGISSASSAATVALPLVEVVAGIVLLAFFVRRQLHLEVPMLKVDVLASPKFRVDVIAVMILQGAMIGGSVLLPLYVQNALGFSATVSGLIILPGALLGAGMAFLSGKIFDRYGVRGVTSVGVVVFAAAGVGTTFYGISSPLVFVCAVYTCFTFAAQMITTPLNTWGVNSLDNRLIQHANSLSNSLNQVAGSVGTALLTALTALGSVAVPDATALEQTCAGDHIAFCGLALLTVACAFTVLVFARDGKRAAAPAAASGEAAAAGGTAVAGAGAAGAAGAVGAAGVGGVAAAGGAAETAGVALAETAGALAAVAGDADVVTRSWTVAEAMDREPKYVLVTQKAKDAFDLFASTETDGVPVIDGERRVVGYLSDGDVLDYFAEKDLGFSGMAANMYRFADDEHIQQTMLDLFELDAMTLATKKVITLDADTSLERACAVFTSRRLKKAPVVCDGKLVGSLSRRNIMSFIASKAS